MIVSFFNDIRDAFPKPEEMSFDDLAARMAADSLIPANRDQKEFTPCIVPATFSPLRRAKANVALRYAFTGDVDDATTLDFDGMRIVLDGLGLAYLLYTTTKSAPDAHRYRVILPFASALSRQDCEAVSSSLHQMLGEVFDTKTFDAGRMSVVPRAWNGSHKAFAYRDGAPVDAQAVMEAFPPILAPEEPEIDLTAFLGSQAAWAPNLADFDQTPLVTAAMVDAYHASQEGGRFYTFMCRMAGRALAKGLPCDESVILSLAMTMNARADGKRRENARHEARRAVRFAASRHLNTIPTTHEDRQTQREKEMRKIIRRKQKNVRV